jgi:hypothetical protein
LKKISYLRGKEIPKLEMGWVKRAAAGDGPGFGKLSVAI